MGKPLVVRCNWCFAILEEPGALVFTPPDPHGHAAPPPRHPADKHGHCTQQARWLAVYGAFIAAQAQQKMSEGRGAPDQDDVDRYVEEAATLANMVAISNKDPER